MAKKVLFVTSAMCKGGAETQMIKVALFLRSLNYTVLIISLKPINEFALNYEKEGIPVMFLDNWIGSPLANSKKLYNAVKAFNPDIVVAFMFIAIIFARILKKLLGFKLISTIRIAVLPAKWYMLFKLTSGLDDAIVYNSNSSKINFERKKMVKIEGIVINNGIGLPDIQSIDCLKTPGEIFVWVCVAHFRWNKDYNTLFKAISLLKGRNFRVDIIGEYTRQNDPRRLVRQLKIQDHVNILGFKQNTAHYLKYADAFVLSSHSEGMPNALLEAMAYSKPVVVTNIDCNSEVLQHSGCGLLSEIENEKDLAAQMLSMMKMPADKRNSLGLKGRKYVEENFAEHEVMNNWLQVINQHATNHEPAITSVL